MLLDKLQDCKPLSDEAYCSHNHGCKYFLMDAVVEAHNDLLSDVPDMDQRVFHDLCVEHHLAQDGALHDDGMEVVHNDQQDDDSHDVLHGVVEEVHIDQQGGEIHDVYDALHDVQQEHALDGLLWEVVGHSGHLVDDGGDVEL